MKKILLILTIVFTITNVNAQISSEGYGWKFYSTKNFNNVTQQIHYGNIEFYYNVNNDNLFKIVYVNGLVEKYIPSSIYPYEESTTTGGYKYRLYYLIDLQTKKRLNLQVFYELGMLRLVYSDCSIEFSY
jgi:hypothetical protein